MRYSFLTVLLISCAHLTEAETQQLPAATLAPVSNPTIKPSSRWRWENPTLQGNKLAEFWGDSAGFVWAVGDKGTIIRSQNERDWELLSSPTTEDLIAITGTAKAIFIADN